MILLVAQPLFAQPRNLGNTESPVSARCVSADGLSFESCGGGAGSSGNIVDGVSASIKATVFDRTNSNPLATQLVDSNGDPVSVGGGTQYGQGSAATDTDQLMMAGCVRADTAAIATGVADGDRARCIVDSTGKLWVNVGTVAVTGPLTDAQLRATPVPVSGTVTVTDGAGSLNVIVDSGSITANAGTNLNTSALLTTTAHDNAFGTAGSADSQVRTIQGIASMTPVTVSGTVTVTDGAGALNVICDSGCGGAASFEDDDPFTATTTPINIMGALYDTTPPAITDGNAGAVRMNSSRALLVDGSAVTQPVSGTVTANQGGSPWQVQSNSANIATQTTAASILTGIELIDDTIATTGAAITGKGQAVSGTDGTNARILKTDTNGELQVDVLTLPSVTIGTFPDNEPFNLNQIGGNAISAGNGTSGTGVQRVTIASDSTGIIGPVPLTSGGTSISRTVSAATTNATNVKASAGQVYQIVASNVNAEERYVHLYNSSSAPSCGTGIVATFIIPGATTGGGTNVTLNPGAAFGTGIGFCITTAVDGTGSVSANETVLNIFYK